MPKTILFDIDGTLVDSNPAHVTAWQRAFAAQGFDFDEATIHSQVGKGGDNLVPSLVPDVPEDLQKRIDAAHGEIYRAEFLPHLKPFPGARDLVLTAQHAGHTVMLASSASADELDHHVKLLDLGDVIDGATSKDDVEHSKPCPDIFDTAARKAGADPATTIVIGDTPYDLIAARRLGMAALAVRSGGFADADLAAEGPVAIYDDVAAILADFDRSPLAG